MSWWNESTAQNSPPITVGVVSDPGIARDENEDAYGDFVSAETDERVCIVADGMGGHRRGQEASRAAVAAVQETFFGVREGTVLERLRRAFCEANDRVYGEVKPRETAGAMGTTATAVALVEGELYLAHVGDSRAYLFRANESRQLTRDHTVAREMQRRGTLTADEARSHPRRGTLTRAIGVEPNVDVDLNEIGPFRAGDRLLLCTDGLDSLPKTVLREKVLDHPPQRACEHLVQRANERGGHDNATALVIHKDQS